MSRLIAGQLLPLSGLASSNKYKAASPRFRSLENKYLCFQRGHARVFTTLWPFLVGWGGADSGAATESPGESPRVGMAASLIQEQALLLDRALPHQALTFAIGGTPGVIGCGGGRALPDRGIGLLCSHCLPSRRRWNQERMSESPTRRILPDSAKATRVLVARR